MDINRLAALVITLLVLPAAALAGNSKFNVREYGAAGDGMKVDTAALQQAIDAAGNAGGGTVIFPPGRYLSSSLDLKSHVTLQLDEGAVLLGSPHRLDYRKVTFYGLLLASNQQDIAVCGKGVIDGQGVLLADDTRRLWKEKQLPNAKEGQRPVIINFVHCKNVTMRDFTLKDSACWVEDYRDCESLTVENIKVRSIGVANNDGIDIDGCKHVVMRGCDIDSEDDGICLKSIDQVDEDILVENCRVRSSCNALKFGTSSAGGFKNIICRNLEIYDTYEDAIALHIVDGGVMENVQITNIKITDSQNAIFIRLGHRNVDGPVGTIHGVTISDVTASILDRPRASMTKLQASEARTKHRPTLITSSIVGLPEHPVQDVLLKNITIIYGGIKSPAQPDLSHLDNLAEVPENAPDYPQGSMFGVLPAWGFYCRHATGIKFDNVTLRVQNKDYRPALVCDDVRNLDLNGFLVKSAASEPVILLNDVKGATIRNSPAPQGAGNFIKQMGNTQDIQTP